MPDAKKPDDKDHPQPVTPSDANDPAELSDEELDKVSGGLAAQRFARPVARPISSF